VRYAHFLPPSGIEQMDSTRASRHFRRARQRAGFALVFVLSMLVLVLIVVLAYFSRTALHRQISSASAGSAKAQLFSRTAEGFILDDIQHEIEAGSLADSMTNVSLRMTRPNFVVDPAIGVPVAPSMAPQRVAAQGITNIVKVSRGAQPFFTTGSGYRTSIPQRSDSGLARSSSISTTNASLNGRSVPLARWNRPRLMSSSELAAFTPPDWIYVDRSGGNPQGFSTNQLSAMSSTSPTNTAVVIGRYAYVIYDVGGLVDINVVGNGLTESENSRRGRLHQASLTNGIGGVPIPSFQDFVSWRSADSRTNTNVTPGAGGLFDPKRTFQDVPSGEQAFVSRQDLISYASRPGSPIPGDALPFLTVMGTDVNAPSFEPSSVRSKIPATPNADAMNPAVLSVRHATNSSLTRPGSATLEVKSGTPVMLRRFPLNKLNLFAESDPDQLLYYFGLTKVNDHTWRYTRTTSDGRIARLSEIANLGREPNFFEVLQAGMLTGSLGRSGVNTYTAVQSRDSLQNLQIVQIAANIIDQWDADDIPTCIQYPSGNPGEYLSSFGTENLPYVSQIALVAWRPTYDRDLFQVWALFDVWNPHQNARTPPVGIDGFRIVPTGGTGWVNLYYTCNTSLPEALELSRKIPSAGGTLFSEVQTATNDMVSLNSGRTLSFSATQDYSEPTTLGGTPTSMADTPGVLVIQCRPGIAIPPAADRHPSLQTTIASLEASSGRTVGLKAYNTCRLRSSPSPPANKGWEFALQLHKSGDPANTWVTYQTFENFCLNLSDIMTCPLSGDAEANLPLNTQHGSAGATLTNEFYSWRSRGTTVGMVKADPRTNRLGFSGWSQTTTGGSPTDFLGFSVRSSTGALPSAFLSDVRGNTVNNSSQWAFPGGVNAVGRDAPTILAPGFQVFQNFERPPQTNRFQIGLYGLVGNNPDTLSTDFPVRYSDPDGVVRPGDGVFGTLPTVPGQLAVRPIILNRPFRSVGELGYVFRDIPWKTLDFFTWRSADLGLLDLFSISETEANPPLTAGQINLNTRQTAALAALLRNASKQLDGVNPGVPASALSTTEAQSIAQAIVSESTVRPFSDRGDLVTRVLNSTNAPDPLAGANFKPVREASIRALAELGTTRTWTFLIDLIVQTGRFTSMSRSGNDFLVQGEERVWIHCAIDRMSGEVTEIYREVVNE